MSDAALRLPEEKPAALVAGKYELKEKLGEGGMGVVYRAIDTATGREVALKQLLSHLAGQRRASVEALFEREYHALVRLKHPRIIEVYDYGRTDEGPFYTMELLAGEDLVKAAPLPYRVVCRILRDVVSSLALVHANRWVHRDVSPRNVRITPEGRAKLIDFGALAAFGTHQDVVGTPTCLAPETLHSQPLDQRTDLFSVGAVAYWALTRKQAYPARSLADLPAAWSSPPVAPSSTVAEVPPELDALVLSLLSLDPMARPASAAAVIDALTVIGGLEPEEQDQTADHYLHSGRLVGRSAELEFIERALGRAVKGTGTEIVLEGPAGIGKTRLLSESAVEAQLKGMVVLKADALANPEPLGLCTALALQMLRENPELARRTADGQMGVLAQLSPEVQTQLGGVGPAQTSADHAERRARVQTALHEWFLAFSREKPTLLAVDNIHAADDNSAAFLAALGYKAKRERLVIMVTQRTGERAVAPTAIKALRRRGNQMKLGSLSQQAVEELVGSLFGQVDNAGRLAKVLFEHAAGNPQHTMDLAQLLVRRQVARYVGGTWVLPFALDADSLPSRADEATALKLATLTPTAQALLQALSVYNRPVGLPQALKMLSDTSEPALFSAIDELVAEQVLCVERDQVRFLHNTLRESVLARMDDTERKARHLRAAEALLSDGEQGVALRIEAAWHLMRAGDETRGADLMAAAGREFLRNQSLRDSPAQVVEALRTAAAVYERQKRSEYELVPLLSPLVALGFHLDWHSTLKYGERAIDMALHITGLSLAQKLRRFLGAKLGLIVALVIAGVRFRKRQKAGLAGDLKQTIGSLLAMVPACVGTHSICYDLEGVRRLVYKLEPLRLFGREHVATLLHDFAKTQALMNEGREFEARRVSEELVRRYEAPHVAQAFGEGHYKSIYGGVLFTLGCVYPYEFGTKTLDIAARLDALGVRTWAMGADQLRLLHHALRGETERAQYYRERVELYAVQGSSSWQAEIFWPVLMLTSEALAGDTIGVRRLAEQLASRAIDVPGLMPYADAAKAIYLNLRGNHGEAIAAFERVLHRLPPRGRVAWHSIRAFYADALNRAGEHAKARDVAADILARAIPGEEVMVVRFLEPWRQLALAEAGLGNGARAVQILDKLIAAHRREDNRLLLGLLHSARAEVAAKLGDSAARDAQLGQALEHFRATANPAAIAQWESLDFRLHRSERSAGLTLPLSATYPMSVHTQQVQTELHAAQDPFACALAMVVKKSGASSGHLYLVKGGALTLCSATLPTEPPREVEQLLSERVQHLNARVAEAQIERAVAPDLGDHTVTAIVPSAPPMTPNTHQIYVLNVASAGDGRAIGGIILEVGAKQQRLDGYFLDALACSLADFLVNTATTF